MSEDGSTAVEKKRGGRPPKAEKAADKDKTEKEVCN